MLQKCNYSKTRPHFSAPGNKDLSEKRTHLEAACPSLPAEPWHAKMVAQEIHFIIIWPAPWADKINQILRCGWLPERARWSYLARSGLPAVSRKKFPRKPYNKSFIDQACSVKMAWYWPRSFLASLWAETESRSINTQKKNLANTQPSWPHTWSITHTYWLDSH